ncbi:MAG: polyphosphate polymerase domain-containing protein [Christensenellales bacterium]|jgi:hypothetical protein
MARRKQDDIFRRLNKQKPLIKNKELKPLSSHDFKPARSSFDSMAERKADRRRKTKRCLDNELSIFSDTKKRAVYKKNQTKQGNALAGRYKGKKNDAKDKKQGLIFTEQTKPAPNRQTGFIKPQFKKQEPAMRYAETTGFLRPNILTQRAVYPKADAQIKGRLTFRHELKYYINYRDYILLKNALKSLISLDAHAGSDNTYLIRSLYFDDVYESALIDKIAGSDVRSKYRIRIYNLSDDVIKFEKKMKLGQYITKKSIALSRDEYDRIIAGDTAFLLSRKEELASEIYLKIKNNLLKPRVVVDYRREAYVSPFENVRITFDMDLKSGLLLTDIFDPYMPVMPMYDSGLMVLEIKFDRYLPEYIRCILSNLDTATRSAISKYVICRKYE